MRELVSGMIDMLKRTLGENIEITMSQPKDLWLCEADPSQLENAILNLSINARDAMPNGGTLTIEVKNTQLDGANASVRENVQPGQYVVLSVSDNGSGIPKNLLNHVFEPFFTTKEIGKGSGLGLSMIYGFARQSGGHVVIESEENEGTRVQIYLPRSLREDASAEEKEPADNIPAAQGETILVV